MDETNRNRSFERGTVADQSRNDSPATPRKLRQKLFEQLAVGDRMWTAGVCLTIVQINPRRRNICEFDVELDNGGPAIKYSGLSYCPVFVEVEP
jgi:hypothetical protein